jgi:hypothetical protein
MSEIVKSEVGKIGGKRGRKPKDTNTTTPVELKAESIVQEVDAVGESDLVRDAVLLADTELVLAMKTYDDRRTENTNRFFQHVRSRQQQTSHSVRLHLAESYGLTEGDIYGTSTPSD